MNSNIALITTLYNTPGSDFYKDIYFPLIRYSVKCIYSDFLDLERPYDVIALQEKIIEKSGISIPLHVLKASVRAIAQKGPDSGIQLYSGGNYFKITASIIQDFSDTDSSVEKISSQYRKLEIFFAEFLEATGLTSGKNLKDFFQDSSLEVLEYINNSSALSVVNEEYVNVVRFIDWIKKERKEYYPVIESLLWGAIIAGFLQRSNSNLGIKAVQKADYYLDSSLVLSLLGLDSHENIEYAKELVRIIITAGATVKVHSITIRELTRILEQVERSQSPRRGSSIEHAWAEQDLTLSDILHIRNNLVSRLHGEGVSLQPVSDAELDRIELKYENHYDVKLLATQRGARNEDMFREIHDIFMRDYVQNLNLQGTVIEKQNAYFVSLNSDLVSFSQKTKGSIMSVIHAAKVVMNLWLHSANSMVIKKTALTEVMARCYALNQTDVRVKLNVFYRYYRECSLTQSDVEGMYTSLIHRSINTINAAEELLENEEHETDNKAEISKEIINGLKIAVAQEKSERDAGFQYTQAKIQELTCRTQALENAIEEGNKESAQKNNQIKQFEDALSDKEETIRRLEEELKVSKELRLVDSELSDAYGKRRELNKQREESVTYFSYWSVIALESLALLFLGVCIFMFIKTWDNKWLNKFSIASAFSLIVLVTRLPNMYILSPKVVKMKIRNDQYKLWEDQHPEYERHNARIKELEDKKRALEGV